MFILYLVCFLKFNRKYCGILDILSSILFLMFGNFGCWFKILFIFLSIFVIEGRICFGRNFLKKRI